MKLFDKIKSVLFEEEEIEIPAPVEEKRLEVLDEEIEERTPRVSEVKEKPPVVREVVQREVLAPKKSPIVDEIDNDFIERDIFNPKKTFEFPVFDESDFEDTKRFARVENDRVGKEKSKKLNFGRFDESKPEEQVEDKSFKPSPVISPVYGILDQNYKKEDIKEKNIIVTESKKRALTVDSVRNKAYGTLEDEIESILPGDKEEIVELEEDMDITSPKKTIDDLLIDAIDETITVGDMEDRVLDEVADEESKEERLSDTINVLDSIEAEIEGKNNSKETLENDTLESDLFNLIDSMYDTREEE